MEYQYSPLSVQPGPGKVSFSIRLLHLLPGSNPNSVLQCRLVETQIPVSLPGGGSQLASLPREQDPGSPQYQALSYTWGEPRFSRSLYVLGEEDGERGEGGRGGEGSVINITENLYSALHSLRKKHDILVLWVDAVCINQNDILERNSQVGSMFQTYTRAANVLVWLGPDDRSHNGRLCFEAFQDLASRIDDVPGNNDLAAASSWRKRLIINEKVSHLLSSLYETVLAPLLNRSWFLRRWIVQEVVLANNVFIHLGETRIQWETFETALNELFESDRGGFPVRGGRASFRDRHRIVLRTMSRIRHPHSGTRSQVPLDILIDYASFLCADPRDRLYALYGVIQHWFPTDQVTSQQSPIGNIDYSLPIEKVYTDFAVRMMDLNEFLPPDITYHPITHVLQIAGALRQPDDYSEVSVWDEVNKRLPSWVPNWTGSLTFTPLHHSPEKRDASRLLPRRRVVTHTSDGLPPLLDTIGIVQDVIAVIIPFSFTNRFNTDSIHSTQASMNLFLQRVVEQLGCGKVSFLTDLYWPTGEHLIRALAITLVANWELTPTNSYFAQNPTQFPLDFLKQLEACGYRLSEILHKWPAYVELVAHTMRGRYFFFTRSGYMGICSAAALEGDVVTILSDMRVPFVLRPSQPVIITDDAKVHFEVPGLRTFINDVQMQKLVEEVRWDPWWAENHCTFRLVGDAYVHGMMTDVLPANGFAMPGTCQAILIV
ncbi:HET-domain-containing protein [Xylariaceae sp. FL0255]|nr:HET-domain-containing protein [Xylariaceae sp. FL0255]